MDSQDTTSICKHYFGHPFFIPAMKEVERQYLWELSSLAHSLGQLDQNVTISIHWRGMHESTDTDSRSISQKMKIKVFRRQYIWDGTRV